MTQCSRLGVLAVLALAIALGPLQSAATTVTGVTECGGCTQYDDGTYQPAWSPDGNYLAFVNSSAWPPYYEWWQSISAGPLHGEQIYYYGESGLVEWPAWSPDSRRLLFCTWQGLMVASLEGHQPAVLAPGFDFRHPAWSPDGATIAFEKDGNVWLMPAAGGTATPLTTEGGGSPTWSPDDNRIAYEASGTIFIVPASGGTPKLLTSGRDPAWSPDGTWIAFSSDRSGNSDIWVIANTGGTAVRITSDPALETDPTWAPDQRSIAYTATTGYCNCIWIVADLPDFRVDVQPATWSRVKDLYR